MRAGSDWRMSNWIARKAMRKSQAMKRAPPLYGAHGPSSRACCREPVRRDSRRFARVLRKTLDTSSPLTPVLSEGQGPAPSRLSFSVALLATLPYRREVFKRATDYTGSPEYLRIPAPRSGLYSLKGESETRPTRCPGSCQPPALRDVPPFRPHSSRPVRLRSPRARRLGSARRGRCAIDRQAQ